MKICQEIGIDGICTIASDVAAPTVAYVANKMNLVGNDYEAAVRANNKYQMREAFMKAGVPCPKYMMLTSESIVLMIIDAIVIMLAVCISSLAFMDKVMRAKLITIIRGKLQRNFPNHTKWLDS